MIFVLAFSFLLTVQNIYRHHTKDGVHFHPWTSDSMMQSLPVKQLQQNPVDSILYLHKQAPALSFIRVIATSVYKDKKNGLLNHVDSLLHWIWLIFYSIMSVLIFHWLSKMVNMMVALIMSAFWIIYPPSIYYATLIEPTLLSSLLIMWFFYELWKIKEEKNSSLARLIIVTVLLFYVRSFFQWYFIVLIAFSLVVMNIPKKSILYYLIFSFLFTGPYMLKQFMLFNTIHSSTFAGYHYCGMIWHKPTSEEILQKRGQLNFSYPIEAKKIESPYNDEKQFWDYHTLTRICSERIKTYPWQSLRNIWKSMKQNYSLAIMHPSSRYVRQYPNIIMEHLPWRNKTEIFFAGYLLILFCGIAILSWGVRTLKKIKKRGLLLKEIAYIVPALYIIFCIGVCNRYEWSEADRFKFLLEPVLFIFVISELTLIYKGVKSSFIILLNKKKFLRFNDI